MAIRVKYSQHWIKLYNVFTPTAHHNDRLYSVSTTEYQIPQLQKYLTSHLWWLRVVCKVLCLVITWPKRPTDQWQSEGCCKPRLVFPLMSKIYTLHLSHFFFFFSKWMHLKHLKLYLHVGPVKLHNVYSRFWWDRQFHSWIISNLKTGKPPVKQRERKKNKMPMTENISGNVPPQGMMLKKKEWVRRHFSLQGLLVVTLRCDTCTVWVWYVLRLFGTSAWNHNSLCFCHFLYDWSRRKHSNNNIILYIFLYNCGFLQLKSFNLKPSGKIKCSVCRSAENR